ncbi:G5 domain-containing protein [Actinoplanes sp. TFC3]|uniref:G5 domain-containing protein n=1 Tax=Actinoplanes sp. TFC3 TaxID=1710355 RepID=UPI001F40D928|nr:G5 domain-containing protein [Actinoplanes sp. TFC3]
MTNRMRWWNRLGIGPRAGLVAAALILPCCGGLWVIGAVAGDDKPAGTLSAVDNVHAATGTKSPAAAPLASALAAIPAAGEGNASPQASDKIPSQEPVMTKRTITEKKAIPYKKRQVDDDSLPKGEREKRTTGIKGEKTLTYEVTLVDGREQSRELVGSEVTRKPVSEVVAVGTYEEPDGGDGNCTPGYDPCVPVASDVDCAGGSGNGPAYVDGPITVTGSDPYELDRDGDGIACDT